MTLFLLLTGSNLTNKYNPQEPCSRGIKESPCSNLTNKYNPQEPVLFPRRYLYRSNLTNKYNPQEQHQ